MPSLNPKLLKRNLIKRWKILRGDFVQVISGKDKGKQGRVLRVYRDRNRVLVEGVNMVTKHIKKTRERPGMKIQKEAPIHYSNVMLICPETGKPTRISYQFTENNEKVRVAKVSGAIIPKPEPMVTKRTNRPKDPLKDTTGENALKKTYHERELLKLKDKYLAKLELDYYNHLKQLHENALKEKIIKSYNKRKFEYDVFQRAKQLYDEETRPTVQVAEEVPDVIKISEDVKIKFKKEEEMPDYEVEYRQQKLEEEAKRLEIELGIGLHAEAQKRAAAAAEATTKKTKTTKKKKKSKKK